MQLIIAGILNEGSSDQKESVVILNEIMKTFMNTVRNVTSKNSQSSNTQEGEFIVWYVLRIRLR